MNNGFVLNNYKSIRELQDARPNVKNLRALFAIPRGMDTIGELVIYIHKHGATGQIFRIGNLIWQEAETTERVK